MLTLRRLLFWVKYMRDVQKYRLYSSERLMVTNEVHTNTCWKLLIRLSLSSGSGIIGKFLISHMLKIM